MGSAASQPPNAIPQTGGNRIPQQGTNAARPAAENQQQKDAEPVTSKEGADNAWKQIRTGVKQMAVLNGMRIQHKFPTGEVYHGDFKDGKLHGHGTLAYGPDDNYTGEFENDLKHGVGTYNYANGDMYSGEWMHGDKSGQGIYFYKNGNNYNGAWKSDLMHGRGVFAVAINGSSYDGLWANGTRHGTGIETNTRGDAFNGTWVRGKKGGIISIQYAVGDVYVGRCRDGQIDGPGIVQEGATGDMYRVEHVAGYLTYKSPVDVACTTDAKYGPLLVRFNALCESIAAQKAADEAAKIETEAAAAAEARRKELAKHSSIDAELHSRDDITSTSRVVVVESEGVAVVIRLRRLEDEEELDGRRRLHADRNRQFIFMQQLHTAQQPAHSPNDRARATLAEYQIRQRHETAEILAETQAPMSMQPEPAAVRGLAELEDDFLRFQQMCGHALVPPGSCGDGKHFSPFRPLPPRDVSGHWAVRLAELTSMNIRFDEAQLRASMQADCLAGCARLVAKMQQEQWLVRDWSVTALATHSPRPPRAMDVDVRFRHLPSYMRPEAVRHVTYKPSGKEDDGGAVAAAMVAQPPRGWRNTYNADAVALHNKLTADAAARDKVHFDEQALRGSITAEWRDGCGVLDALLRQQQYLVRDWSLLAGVTHSATVPRALDVGVTFRHLPVALRPPSVRAVSCSPRRDMQQAAPAHISSTRRER